MALQGAAGHLFYIFIFTVFAVFHCMSCAKHDTIVFWVRVGFGTLADNFINFRRGSLDLQKITMRLHLKVRSHGNLLGLIFFLVQNRAKKLDFEPKKSSCVRVAALDRAASASASPLGR